MSLHAVVADVLLSTSPGSFRQGWREMLNRQHAEICSTLLSLGPVQPSEPMHIVKTPGRLREEL
ncbi:hypothetical protein M405DRAFT_834643 [Rhizopogon salebrosus TDB-379]|nr:hypothetical protein M405DRAFT_834643 [Rhizopogon salebrosus TDB-379]